jgi:hypothetical protein
MIFSNLWAGRAVTTTLSPKFGGPAQRWGRASLGKGGAGWNPGPPSPHLPPPPPLPPPLPLGLGGGRPRGACHLPWWQGGPRGLTSRPANRGPGFHPAPPFPRPALPHFWAGPPNFGDSVVVTIRPALPKDQKKSSGQHNFFSTTPN